MELKYSKYVKIFLKVRKNLDNLKIIKGAKFLLLHIYMRKNVYFIYLFRNFNTYTYIFNKSSK